MQFRSFLLAGAVFPFALAYPAFALDRSDARGALVIAQAETACPEGASDCVPPEAVQEQPQTEVPVEAPVEAQPAPEPAPAEEPPQPEPAPAEPPAAEAPETPAFTPPPEEPPVEEAPVQEVPVEEAPVDVAPEPAPPAAEEPPPVEAPAPEEVAPDQPVMEAPPADEQPTEAPAIEVPPSSETPATEAPTQEAPAQEAPAEIQPDQQPEEPVTDVPVEQQPQPEQPAEIVQPDIPVEQQAPVPGESVVEQQLEAQGDENAAEQVLEMLQRLQQQQQEAQTEAEASGVIQPDRAGRDQPWWVREGGRIVERRGDRVVVDVRGQIFVEPLYPDRDPRLLYGADDVEVQYLRGGYTRTIVHRDNGSQIVTVRDEYGDLVSRVRIRPDGSEVVLFDARYDQGGPPPVIFEPNELPPLYIPIPEDQYIVDLGGASPQQVQQVLLAPPVEQVQRPYTVAEVTQNERLRDIVPRLDLDTITFDFGSATISPSQTEALTQLGRALEAVIADSPNEVYLIEGHTDAVGSQNDNLILSDQRAESVAVALTYNFDIPPENLITEGYGEQYLKVNTQEPERLNRRVAVRRITPLLQAENQ